MQRVLLVWLMAAAAGASCSGRLSLSDPGGSGGGSPPTAPLASDHPTVALVSAVGGDGRARVDWARHSGSSEPLELALFLSTDRPGLFSGVPLELGAAERHVIVEGLTRDVLYHAGLGVRLPGASEYAPAGPVLRLWTGAPVYVNPAFDPGFGDGLTPATAFGDLLLGLVVCFAAGGGNVWVAEGSVAQASLPLYSGVFASGGFRSDFELSRRSSVAHATLVGGAPGAPVFTAQTGALGPVILDGFTIDGAFVATDGVRDVDLDAELRSLDIRNCQRGVRLLTNPGQGTVPVLVTGTRASSCALEGLSVAGAFDLEVDSCLFELNGNEGLDLNHLLAPPDETAEFLVRGSSFQRNGAEGLDLHLGVPTGGGEPGGLFRISVVDCDFELNQLDGCRIDVDYETFAAWDSHIVVRGSRARANGAAGFHLDLDARCDAILERVRASANLGDGLLVSSESAPGMAVVHASSFDANAGRGIAAAQGHFGLLVSRCLVSANAAGGMTSPVVPSSAVSSLAVQQDDPWGSLEAHGSLEQAEGLPLLAQNLPLDWARIVADESGILVLDREPGVLAAWGETADDGTPRELTWLGTDRLRLDPPPSSALPLPLALFAGADVREDYRLTPGSAALGAGLAAPFALPTDAGPCASGESVVPGREAALPDELFRLARSLPAWSVPIAPQTELRLEFEGGIPAASTLAQGVWVLSASGVPLVASLVLVDGAILVTPPAGGWQSGQRLELHPALRSTTDAALAGPLSIPIRVP